MANLLDIAVTLFGPSGGGGSGGGGGRHSGGGDTGSTGTPSSSSSRVKQSKNKDDKLVTFTVDVHAGNSTTLGVTVKELGGGAVFVEVYSVYICMSDLPIVEGGTRCTV